MLYELDIIYVRTCTQNVNFVTNIRGHRVEFGRSFGGQYEYDWSCDCKGFHFRKKCSHIEEAKKIKCNWNAELNSEKTGLNNTCPECGGPTTVIKVGI